MNLKQMSWELQTTKAPRFVGGGKVLEVSAYIRARGWEEPLTRSQYDFLIERFNCRPGESLYDPEALDRDDPGHYPKAPIDCAHTRTNQFSLTCRDCGMPMMRSTWGRYADPNVFYQLKDGQLFCTRREAWFARLSTWIKETAWRRILHLLMNTIGYCYDNMEWQLSYDKNGRRVETVIMTRTEEPNDPMG